MATKRTTLPATSGVDPGYGDPLAPVGSAEWAKRWRLCFQSVAKELPEAPKANLEFYEIGLKYRAWTLITDADGKTFPDFDDFCRYRQPWGLSMDPNEFRSYLTTVASEQEIDLITVPPEQQGNRTDLEETSGHDGPKSDGMSPRKEKRLRAILRTPDVIQDLYREGLVSQDAAAAMGPKKPDEEKAARVVRARKAVEALDRPGEDPEARKQYRKAVDRTIRAEMGKAVPTALDNLCRTWEKASVDERVRFAAQIPRSQLFEVLTRAGYDLGNVTAE